MKFICTAYGMRRNMTQLGPRLVVGFQRNKDGFDLKHKHVALKYTAHPCLLQKPFPKIPATSSFSLEQL